MSSLIILSSLLLILPLHHAAIFDIINNCPYTVWAAAIPGGGRKLESGQNWTINVNARTDDARIWARTGCTFNDSGHGRCQTGDCNGLLECQTYGTPPNTLARFTLNGFNNLDFFDISLAEGFNVPMDFSPAAGCDQRIRCAANINVQCPTELTTPGGCNDPCTVFKTDEYCCYSGNCGPSNYSNFFKGLCPDVFSYPMDDQTTSTFTCVGGTDYKVVFCPTTNLPPPPAVPPPPPLPATFDIVNYNCSYPIWAAAIPGGGRKLDKGQTWTINVKAGTTGGRVWARTGCKFNSSGHGKCETGDCNGRLQCETYGKAPVTIAEFSLNGVNKQDFFDISLVDGFNVPMNFISSDGCNTEIMCSDDMNSECPTQLKAPGGCNNPCTTFKTEEYCCISGASCRPSNYTRFFKGFCPDAYSYPKDDRTSAFTCPGGTNYTIIFCPKVIYDERTW